LNGAGDGVVGCCGGGVKFSLSDSVCFHKCIVHKKRSERISLIWIQGFAGKKRRGYICEQ